MDPRNTKAGVGRGGEDATNTEKCEHRDSDARIELCHNKSQQRAGENQHVAYHHTRPTVQQYISYMRQT